MDASQLHQSLWKGTKQSTHWLSQGKMGGTTSQEGTRRGLVPHSIFHHVCVFSFKNLQPLF